MLRKLPLFLILIFGLEVSAQEYVGVESPDGQYRVLDGDSVILVEVATGNQEILLSNGDYQVTSERNWASSSEMFWFVTVEHQSWDTLRGLGIVTINGEVIFQTDMKPGLTEALWSPDGTYLAYDYWECCEIHLFNVETHESTLLVEEASHPTWSPDSQLLAYVDFMSLFLHIVRPDGTNVADLVPGVDIIAWSNSGDQLFTTGYQWYIFDTDTWEVIDELDWDGGGYTTGIALWSPDDSKIAISAHATYADWWPRRYLYLYQPGHYPDFILHGDFGVLGWTPDSQRLIIKSGDSRTYGIQGEQAFDGFTYELDMEGNLFQYE